MIELLVATLFLYEVVKKLKKTFKYYPLHPKDSKDYAYSGYDKNYEKAGSNYSHVHGDHVHDAHAHDDTTTTMSMTSMMTTAATDLVTEVAKTVVDSSYNSSTTSSGYGGGYKDDAYGKKEKSPLVFPFALIIIACTFLIAHLMDRFKRSKVKHLCP